MVTDPPYGVNYDPLWREGLAQTMNGSTVRVEKAGKVVNRFRANAFGIGAATTTGPTGARPGRCFPAMSPTSGTVALHRGRRGGEPGRRRLRLSGRRSSGPRSGWSSAAATTTGSTSRAGTRCARAEPGNWRGDRKQTTLWQIPSHDQDDRETGHGTQKPVECMRRPIAQQLVARPGGLRSVPRLRHDADRRRNARRAGALPSRSIPAYATWRCCAGRRSPARRRRWRATAAPSKR